MANSAAYDTWNDTKTYKVLRDAIDEGKDFEKLFTTLVSLKLCAPPRPPQPHHNVEDFELATNVAGFGNMDDLVLKLRQTEGASVTMAVQLKHSASKTLTKGDFVQVKGDFNPKRYLDTFKSLLDKSQDWIFVWYTNKKMINFSGEYVLRYDEIKDKLNKTLPCSIKLYQLDEDRPWFMDVLKTKNKDNDDLYRLKIVVDDGVEPDQNIVDEVELYQQFFERLYIFTGQKNKHQVEQAIVDIFNNELECDNGDVVNNFINYVDSWCGLTGLKDKLIKSIVSIKLAQVLLTPHVRTVSGVKSGDIWRTIADAILQFQVTIIDCLDNNIVNNMWTIDNQNDEKAVKLIKKFGFKFGRQEDEALVAWLMHQVPLIVEISDTNRDLVLRAIGSCHKIDPNLKFVLITNCAVIIPNCRILRNLSDLTSHQDITRGVLIQIQGRPKISLGDIVTSDDVAEMVTLHRLLQVAEGGVNLGDDLEYLPSPYITRYVPKIVVKSKILHEVMDDTMVVVTYANDHDLDKWKVTPKGVIFVKEGQLVCTKSPRRNRHHFRLLDDGNLEWKSTEGAVEAIRKFRQKTVTKHFVQDKDVFEYFPNQVGLICEDPGMGKSVMMTFLKNNCPSHLWPVRINLREHYRLFDGKAGTSLQMDHILDQLLPPYGDDFAADLRTIYRRRGQLLLLWDGLDELLSEISIENAIKAMKVMSINGFPQWIAARPHLQDRLEREFNVMALTLKKLDGDEQRWYIRERLKDMCARENIGADDLEQMMSKVTASVKVNKYRDILGVPLQMFMITEICQDVDNFRKISSGALGLSDLYRTFIDGKFDSAYRKTGQEEPKTSIEKYHLKMLKNYQMQRYKVAALKTVFGEAILTKLSISCDDLVEHIRQDGDDIGLISKIEENGDFVFTHNTYAEFLCAMYFYENWKAQRKAVEAILDYDRHVIRYFFDVMLAHGRPLHKAILDEDETNVAQYLESCVNDRDEAGRTPLHLAALIGDAGLVSTLLRHNADRRLVDNFGYLPADWSARYGFRDTLKVVIGCKDESELNEVYAHLVTLLIANEANVNAIDVNKNLALHWSSRYGFMDAVKTFIDNGVDVNVANKYGETALHVAVLGGQPQIVELLLSNNADVNYRNRGGRTALHEAADLGKLDILTVLLDNGADPLIADAAGLTALDLARKQGHRPLARLLSTDDDDEESGGAKAPPPSSAVDEEGSTPMFDAAFSGQLEAIKELIERKEQVNAVNKHGKTPLHKAARHGLNDIVETLIRSGADLDVRDHSGQTALHYAVANRRVRTVQILMTNGANKTIPDDNGLNPVQLAEYLGYIDLVDLMNNTVPH